MLVQIGKPSALTSAISTANPDCITVRGFDLSRDLIGKASLTDLFIILLTGAPATPVQKLFVDAALVSIAEHGLVPSVVAARMTLAAAPDAWQGAVSAGLLGCGSVVLGASETAGQLLADIITEAGGDITAIPQVVCAKLTAMRRDRAPLPGFGHPLHRNVDPRATRLLAMADEQGTAGLHVAALRECIVAIPEVYGRSFAVNVSGAIAAVLLDVQFPLRALKGIPLLARTASLIGHLLEETSNPIGFAMAHAAETTIAYNGEPVRPE